jgi:hypothetical protein
LIEKKNEEKALTVDACAQDLCDGRDDWRKGEAATRNE